MLETHFVPEFNKIVDFAMYDFAHMLLRTYTYIEDVFPHEIDLVMRNSILNVTQTVGGRYLSIAFKSNMTVNQHVFKKMYRKMKGEVVPQGHFDYCLAAELVPDVMDVLGKGGYYDSDVLPSMWGFETPYIREFFDIMPTLKDKYVGDEEYQIHCQSSRFETTNDITQRNRQFPILQLQYPYYCFVYVPIAGDYFLMVDVFFRFYYEMKCKNESFYGHVLSAEIYGFKTTPDLPVSRHEILGRHLESFVGMFHDVELVSPGLKVIPNRHDQLKYEWCYLKSEEICFYYSELHPYY